MGEGAEEEALRAATLAELGARRRWARDDAGAERADGAPGGVLADGQAISDSTFLLCARQALEVVIQQAQEGKAVRTRPLDGEAGITSHRAARSTGTVRRGPVQGT